MEFKASFKVHYTQLFLIKSRLIAFSAFSAHEITQFLETIQYVDTRSQNRSLYTCEFLRIIFPELVVDNRCTDESRVLLIAHH